MPEVGLDAFSPAQLKAISTHKQAEIAELAHSVKAKRLELKNFSLNITKIIEKKIIFTNPYHTHNMRPNFNPHFKHPQLDSLHAQRQQLHSQIQELKGAITVLKSQEEPEIVNEIRKKEAAFQNLLKEETKATQEKQFLHQQMLKNKEQLEYFKNSECLREIEDNLAYLEELKAEIKRIDKQSNQMLSEQVQVNLFIHEMKGYMEKEQKQVEPGMSPVDAKDIQRLVNEINELVGERRQLDEQHDAKSQQMRRNIVELEKSNEILARQLRQLANEDMQKALDKKKLKIKNHRSSISLHKELPKKIIKPAPVQDRQAIKAWEQKADEFEVNQREQQGDIERHTHMELGLPSNNTLIIGNWNEQNCIRDDILESGTISRAVGLKIRTKGKVIVGIGATYINKIGVEVIGRGNIWKTKNDSFESDEEEIQIDLEDVEWLRYTKPTNPTIGLIWELKDGNSVTIGNVPPEEGIESLLLNDHWVIKSAEFSLDSSFASISGIRLKLAEYKHSNPEQEADKSLANKWRSVSDVSLKKKVVVRSHSKKISELSQVDHRLLLNRKKKMV